MTQYIPHAIFVLMVVYVWFVKNEKERNASRWERKAFSEREMRFDTETKLNIANFRIYSLERDCGRLNRQKNLYRDQVGRLIAERKELRTKLAQKNEPYR